ncbi:MAG: hypothetical protein K6E98_12740 [Lachnospiraceae bacterium]|nr:hypothetical protein [Lachnospiraceae bacterium]
MEAINAIYVRMSSLLTELGMVCAQLYKETDILTDKLKYLGISWEGAAYDEYARVLMADLMMMSMTVANMNKMYRSLHFALTEYQRTEMYVFDAIGRIVV